MPSQKSLSAIDLPKTFVASQYFCSKSHRTYTRILHVDRQIQFSLLHIHHPAKYHCLTIFQNKRSFPSAVFSLVSMFCVSRIRNFKCVPSLFFVTITTRQIANPIFTRLRPSSNFKTFASTLFILLIVLRVKLLSSFSFSFAFVSSRLADSVFSRLSKLDQMFAHALCLRSPIHELDRLFVVLSRPPKAFQIHLKNKMFFSKSTKCFSRLLFYLTPGIKIQEIIKQCLFFCLASCQNWRFKLIRRFCCLPFLLWYHNSHSDFQFLKFVSRCVFHLLHFIHQFLVYSNSSRKQTNKITKPNKHIHSTNPTYKSSSSFFRFLFRNFLFQASLNFFKFF